MHIPILLTFLLVSLKLLNSSIILKFEEIARKSSENPESTKALVALHNFIYDSKTEVLFTSKKELAKSAEFIEFLLCYAEVPGK